MKVVVPENQNEVTIRQHQQWEKAIAGLSDEEIESRHDLKLEKIAVFTTLSREQATLLTAEDVDSMNELINEGLNRPGVFKDRFKFNGIEYGFHPNLDKMASSEYINLVEYQFNAETLHRSAAILFRPITKELLGTYQIEKYNGTDEHCETMRDLPLSIMNGAVVFFSNLTRELSDCIQTYLAKVPMKEL